MTFSDRLRDTIAKTGLSRDDFADATGVSRSQIFNYLNEKSDPGLSFFQRLKAAFPWVDLELLMTGEKKLLVEEPETHYGRDEVQKKIAQILEAMDEEKRRDVLKYASEKKQLMDCLEELRKRKRE